MPLKLKAPPAKPSESPAGIAGHNRPAILYSPANQPSEDYRSPLVDALLEQLRKALVMRKTPH